MTRGRLVISFLLFIALCASIAYWGLQLYDPPLRPVAASAQNQLAAPRLEAAAAVFGGQASAAPTASNFQLRGVIFSGTPKDSVAIIAVEDKPPQAFRANTEVVPGVKVQEVHRQYVLLSDGAGVKRIELPAEARNASQAGLGMRAPLGAPGQTAQSGQPEQTTQPVQSAPAQGTTVVTQQEMPVQKGQEAAQAEGEMEGDNSSASSADTGDTTDANDVNDGSETGDTGNADDSGNAGDVDAADAAPEESTDPAQSQANPPRRQ